MREKRSTLPVVALLVTLCAAVGAQDKVPEDKTPAGPKEISRAEWDGLARAVRSKHETTIRKTDRLRELCAQYVIVENGKIKDIRPHPHSRGALALDCSVLNGGGGEWTFFIDKEDEDTVRNWRLSDRISWVVRLSVVDGEVHEEVVYRGIADLNRSMKPDGPEPSTKAAWSHSRRYRPDMQEQLLKNISQKANKKCLACDGSGRLDFESLPTRTKVECRYCSGTGKPKHTLRVWTPKGIVSMRGRNLSVAGPLLVYGRVKRVWTRDHDQGVVLLHTVGGYTPMCEIRGQPALTHILAKLELNA